MIGKKKYQFVEQVKGLGRVNVKFERRPDGWYSIDVEKDSVRLSLTRDMVRSIVSIKAA